MFCTVLHCTVITLVSKKDPFSHTVQDTDFFKSLVLRCLKAVQLRGGQQRKQKCHWSTNQTGKEGLSR